MSRGTFFSRLREHPEVKPVNYNPNLKKQHNPVWRREDVDKLGIPINFTKMKIKKVFVSLHRRDGFSRPSSFCVIPCVNMLEHAFESVLLVYPLYSLLFMLVSLFSSMHAFSCRIPRSDRYSCTTFLSNLCCYQAQRHACLSLSCSIPLATCLMIVAIPHASEFDILRFWAILMISFLAHACCSFLSLLIAVLISSCVTMPLPRA